MTKELIWCEMDKVYKEYKPKNIHPSYVPEYGYWYDHVGEEYYYYDERGSKFVSKDTITWEKE